VSNTKYLICDCVGSSQLEIITNESAGASGSIRFKGKFQEANAQNKNKRLYSFDILERERCRLEGAINSRRLFGELDHPTDSIIHLENASHLITKLWWEGNLLLGEGMILPTPAGKILEAIIRSEIPVGISSRGVGSGKTDPNGVMVIDDSYHMITFDVVADPSTNDAYVDTVRENKFYKHSTIKENKSEKKLAKNETKPVYTTNTIDPHVLIGCLKGIFDKASNS
jgi:hypothetical protein